jgi:pectate lyase
MKSIPVHLVLSWLLLLGALDPCFAAESAAETARFLDGVQVFADTVLQHGRDTYGDEKTPLFVDGLHAGTLQPVRWQKDGETWVLCNFASQQNLMRTLDGLTALTGDRKYRTAAEQATRDALQRLQTPSGLLYWGGHLAWDLEQDKPVGQGLDSHEMKGHQPYYRLMYEVAPKETVRLMEAVWAGHILDWARLDYNRHASVRRAGRPQWDHPFIEDIAVPFPSVGGNLSFCNVTPSLIHAGIVLAVLNDSRDARLWTERLVDRWQQGRDKGTGLCGGQLSYREQDRAQEALGHVHPAINEAKMVVSYHQTSRYHDLPLVQMQAAEALRQTGDADHAALAQKLIDTASSDLKIYARECYDAESGQFIGRMTDGTAIQWQQAKTGYYVPESFAPRGPDGDLFWGYALAYRLTGDAEHKRMVDKLGSQLGLWRAEVAGKPAESIECCDWRTIYAMLELADAADDDRYLKLACLVGDNLLKAQAGSGLFPRPGREYARTGDDIPLALLHLAAALSGRRDAVPAAVFDRRFFHCEYHGELEEYQKKRADARTYDHYVFYGST